MCKYVFKIKPRYSMVKHFNRVSHYEKQKRCANLKITFKNM